MCVSFPGFVAEAFLLLLSSLCSACLHQHFAAIRLPLSLPLPLSPSSSSTRYCFFVFLFLIFLTHFSLDFVYVFLCAFCVALTARAINFNCAFYASPTHPPLPTHSPHSLCCLLFCFIMQKKSTGCRLFLCTSATPRLTPFDGKFFIISFNLFSGTPIFLFSAPLCVVFAFATHKFFFFTSAGSVARQWSRGEA